MSYNPPPPGQSGQPQYPGHMGGPPPSWQPATKGFFGALFDFSFSYFVTPTIIKILYVLGLIGIAMTYLVFIVVALNIGAFQALVVLLLGGIIALVYLAFWRVTLEFFLAVVRMSEDIHHRGFPGNR
jgi:hypothetical protein